MTIQRLDPGARLSEAVVHGGVVYLAGHVSDSPEAGVEQQTREILESIDRHLAAAGTSKSRLLSVSICASASITDSASVRSASSSDCVARFMAEPTSRVICTSSP